MVLRWCGRVPQEDGAVILGRGQQFPVRADRDSWPVGHCSAPAVDQEKRPDPRSDYQRDDNGGKPATMGLARRDVDNAALDAARLVARQQFPAVSQFGNGLAPG
jgi:hypothetical protein